MRVSGRWARVGLVGVCLVAVGCGEDKPAQPQDVADAAAPDTADDVDTDEVDTDTADTDGEEVGPGDADTEPEVTDEVEASSYCERSVEMFCGYYVRCGRMVASSEEECRRVFLETCNARYEPLYADLAARGDLTLSVEGLARCAERLETVACDQQIFDLDGCPDVWRGQHQVGEACGPGLESFVCGEGSVCVLDLSFCGTCHAKAEGACDLETRCDDGHICSEGVCVPRVAVGGACDNSGPPCVLGAACVGGTCQGPEIVAEGEACGQTRRCPYRSQCAGGVCVRTEVVGEACGGAVGCASGHCLDGVCQALREAGSPCTAHAMCTSGRCTAGACEPIGWSCVP